ncbi:hypothetical protein C8J57DRAFT_1095711, partial [Mycena rebaudengoi]
DWQNPAQNFAYSQGKPNGQTLDGKYVHVSVLIDSLGKKVPCVESHSTLPHIRASREDVKERLQNNRDHRLQCSSPKRDIFLHTVSFIAALERYGCRWKHSAHTQVLSCEEQQQKERRGIYRHQTQRGYRKPDSDEPICEGRIVFDYNRADQPYISCEYYDRNTNQAHFHDFNITNGSYDIDYLEAVFCGDQQETARIEEDAYACGYGPLVDCTSVSNFSTQKAFCPISHRNADREELEQPLMLHLSCHSKFRVFTPLPSYRRACPFVLIVTKGEHPHPVPLPTKTPPSIRNELMVLLENLGPDLPDLTPRRLLRHPILKTFLATKFPSIICPTLSDWHVSLANRDHLKAYILHALELHFPFGTDWMGMIHLKEVQDSKLPKESHYIRRIIAIDDQDCPPLGEDEDEDALGPGAKGDKLCIIICMTPEASRRLLSSGRYLQSDIGFKRIVGYKEFELAGMERDSNTSIIFCRVYLNRMTADAHRRVFEQIDAILFEDTGHRLQWRHLHALSQNDSSGLLVLSWVGDQHRGQAKGLGLYLQSVAAKLPRRKDLYEDRYIQDLGPYDHLHRLFRVCVIHFFRLIKTCPVPENVRTLMRSLVCMEHGDWDGTIKSICDLGGKPAQDWIKNKQSSQFVFEGICWAKSFIPRDIWEAGDSNSNVVEIVHQDVNREGLHCTLLGAHAKAQSFDTVKMNTLRIYEGFGITPSYRTRHISENAFLNLKRRDNQSQRVLAADELKMERFKQKLQTALDKLVRAERVVEGKQKQLSLESDYDKRQKLQESLDKKILATTKLRVAYENLNAEGP